VQAAPLARRGDGWAGVAEIIVSTSEERTQPPCPHFGACGGCALQHWQTEHYLAWKARLLDQALRRAGFDPVLAPIAASPPHARRRMDLAIRRQGSRVILGLHAPRGADIVDLQSCTVLHPTLIALVAPLRDLLRSLSLLLREGSAIINLLDASPDLLLRTDAEPDATDRTKLAAFAAAHGMPRISWAKGGETPETLCLLRPPVVNLSGIAVQPPPGAFLQASLSGEEAIIDAVLAALPEKLPAKARVAELYAGTGTLTFALAQRLRVAAFEGDKLAFGALLATVKSNGLAGRIEAHYRDLVRQPLSSKELAGFTAVVLDPPHAGAAAQIARIAAARVPRIVYVSCNPASLSRDARVLRDTDYRLLAATPIDQFLWSARLESVVVFDRG
jgi:23S rRNA (uracil1939-C5)-methyltransferase